MKENINLPIAVIQASPIFMDLEGTLKKTLKLIKEASCKGAKLIVFPEAFIPAYPRGLSFGFVVGSRTMEGRKDWKRYYDNSVAIPGPVIDILANAAKEADAYISIGVIEKDGENKDNTLYCTNLFFGPDGKFLGKHRKLKPTGSERCIWGEGDGSTLTVIDTPYGKMGSLICWENYMPLARVSMYNKGVNIYIAPTADNREEWQCTVRHIALEGRCFVISCNQYITKSMYPVDLNCYEELEKQPEDLCPGGSCVISPFGKYVTEPVWNREEIIMANLDLEEITLSKIDLDVMGHYARPDVFELIVHEK